MKSRLLLRLPEVVFLRSNFLRDLMGMKPTLEPHEEGDFSEFLSSDNLYTNVESFTAPRSVLSTPNCVFYQNPSRQRKKLNRRAVSSLRNPSPSFSQAAMFLRLSEHLLVEELRAFVSNIKIISSLRWEKEKS